MCKYDYFVYGQQTSKLSQIAGYSDVTNDQDEGYGMKFTGKYNYDKNRHQEFDIIVTWKHSLIDNIKYLFYPSTRFVKLQKIEAWYID